MRHVRVFWWRGVPNFGDVLSRDIVEKILGFRVVWAPAPLAELVVVGSIATMLPDGWAGTTLGIGWARPEPYGRLRNARILALRGQLSADIAGTGPGCALGDPGLLAPILVERPPVRHEVGFVPHWNDRSLDSQGHVIDVRQPPAEVIRQIGECERIVSSSLHGIIVADAYGIVRKWHMFPGVQGAGFKFRDHSSVVGEITPGEWGVADADRVEMAREGILRALRLT